MGIKIKNLQTGEFEKFNIPALKGEKGEPGEIEPSEKVDYIGKQHSKLRDTMNANVDYIIKTAIGEFNYLDYEGQHITATNSIEGHAKSAILKGQTLVNLAQPSLRAWTANLNSDTASLKATTEEFIIDWSKGVPFNAWIQARNDNSPVFGGMLKADTDYTFIIRILENNPTFEGVAVTGNVANLQIWGVKGYQSMYYSLRAGVTGTIALKYNFKTLSTGQNIENIFGIAVGGTAANGIKTIDGGKLRISKDIIVLEGDYTNNYQDIPYFEGIQSVKMPVLKTTGKNLFVAREDEYVVNGISVKNENGNIVFGGSSNDYSSFDLITGENFGGYNPNWKSYYQDKILHRVTGEFTFKASLGKPQGLDVGNGVIHQVYVVYDDDKINSIQYDSRSGNEVTKTVKFNVESHINGFFVTRWYGGSCEGLYINSPQIEQGISATQYEPHKSNILTVNEPIELRGIGQGSNRVEDELDCLTGEVTERIGEYQITGEENWDFLPSHRRLQIERPKFIPNIKCGAFACDKLQAKQMNHDSLHGTNGTYYIGYTSDNWLRIILDENLTSLEQGKEWLKANKPTIQYQLATESIKTVDLSDNHVYSYKGTTYYDCSSAEGSLVPTLSVKVPTDTQLTIQEQKATTQTLLIKNMDLQQSIKEVQAMNLAFNTALYNSFNSIREEVEDIKKHVSTNENLEGSF